MTDKKDIKDYCKNCDVEPPAMRFKCPTCKHNPDKKEIIIDGVDASKCEHSFKQFDNWVGKDVVLCDCTLGFRCEPKENHCKFYMYYLEQQLQLKKQECETLASQLDFEVQKRECLEHKYEEAIEWQKANQPTGICETCTTRSVDDMYKYKQALEDIKKTILDYPSKGIQEVQQSQIEYTQHLLNVSEIKLRKVLTIINKVKDEQ